MGTIEMPAADMGNFNMEYSLKEHKHRFAIWTAARAVQRSWTTTFNISHVITSVNLLDFVGTYQSLLNQEEFDALHSHWCEKMINEFEALNIKATYGRVAKIIAIYLKTSIVVCRETDDDQLRFIHPPIDRILLKNLPGNRDFSAIQKLNWTQFDKESYWKVVNTIREQLGFFDWRLELLWRPELEKAE